MIDKEAGMDGKKLITRVLQVAWHRNGVGGEGFHAVIFEVENERCANPECNSFDGWGWIRDGKPTNECLDCKGTVSVKSTDRMVASVFRDVPGENIRVAVFDVAKLADPAIGVAFGENSWRGDCYARELRDAIETHDSDGSIKVGPFAIPTKRKAARK